MTDHFDLVLVSDLLPVERVGAGPAAPWQVPDGDHFAQNVVATVAAEGGLWVGRSADPTAALPPDVAGVSLDWITPPQDEVADDYAGQSTATIWPLYHDALDRPVFHRRWRQAYQEMNQLFAARIAQVAATHATVWINDYHLQLMPRLLRRLRPDLAIGFLLHIPFPPAELFMRLPLRTEIIAGLLGADLIGFQHPRGAQNFLRLAEELLGHREESGSVDLGDRRVTVGVFALPVNGRRIAEEAATPAIRARAQKFRADLGGPTHLLLGIDRLDHVAGLSQRLAAYRELLAEGAPDPAETVLVQVATPSTSHPTLREEVEREVAGINGTFGRVGHSPVHYLHRVLDPGDLTALSLAADVMLATPLRGSTPLVAKGYVCAHTERPGALILSEFAGAGADLPDSFLVNPHDIDAVKESIRRALRTPATDLLTRCRAMAGPLIDHDTGTWTRSFLSAVRRAAEPAPSGTVP